MNESKSFPEVFNEQSWVKEIVSPNPGPTLGISCCIHGDEKAGISILRKIQDQIGLTRGRLYLHRRKP